MKDLSVLALFGLMVVLNGLALSAYFVAQKYSTPAAILFGSIAGFLGLALILSDRLEILELFKIGKLVTRAETEVEAIAAIRTAMEKQKKAFNEDLGELRQLIEVAGDAVRKIEETQAFAELVSDADTDNLSAFEKLVELSKSDSPKAPKAKRAAERIETYYFFSLESLSARIPWDEHGIDPRTASIDEFHRIYDKFDGLSKKAFQEAVFDSPVIRRPDKLQFLVDLLDKETSIYGFFHLLKKLKPSTHAGHYFSYDSEDRAKIKKWWQENKERIIAEDNVAREEELAAQRASEERQRKQREYHGKILRIQTALSANGIANVRVHGPRGDLPQEDFETIILEFDSGLSVGKTEAELMEAIEKAKNIEELQNTLGIQPIWTPPKNKRKEDSQP